MEGLVCWATKLMKMTGWLLSMPDNDDFEKKNKKAQEKVLTCWKGFEEKKAFYLDLYTKSGNTDAYVFDQHENCHIWMGNLFNLLQRLKQL